MRTQESIYDQRYRGDGYDNRSAVRVLTAERLALDGAIARARSSQPKNRILSVLDYGYGTGRVTNEFMLSPQILEGFNGELRVIAYDVSQAGLNKAMRALRQYGFKDREAMNPEATSAYGRMTGYLSRRTNGILISCYFVHGQDGYPLADVKRLLAKVNNGRPFTLTLSWYSGISHIPGAEARLSVFTMLGELTHPRGEMVITASALGDPVDGWQQIWQRRLERGDVSNSPAREAGDMMYETEIPGLINFYHVYSTDFIHNIQAAARTEDRRFYWLEGIRFPDREFTSAEEERINYRQVDEFNHYMRGKAWRPDDFKKIHTVGGFFSPIDPELDQGQ